MKQQLLRKYNFLVALLLLVGVTLQAQVKSVSFSELEQLQQLKKKPVLVFINTSWCQYCAAMKQTSFKKKELIKQLNDNYYFVSLEADGKEPIQFKGTNFIYKPSGPSTGVNQLAEQLGLVNGRLTYPTLCFLNDDFEIIHQQVGYLTASDLSKLLTLISKN